MEKNNVGNVGIKSAPHTFSPKIVIPKNTIKVAILPHPVEETLKKIIPLFLISLNVDTGPERALIFFFLFGFPFFFFFNQL